jgi:hypothetical protein
MPAKQRADSKKFNGKGREAHQLPTPAYHYISHRERFVGWSQG